MLRIIRLFPISNDPPISHRQCQGCFLNKEPRHQQSWCTYWHSSTGIFQSKNHAVVQSQMSSRKIRLSAKYLWTSWTYSFKMVATSILDKQRVLMHGHQGWNVRHSLCHIYMIYVYIWVVYSFCLLCCLFIIVTTQFVALYKPCKPKPKPSTYDPPDNHPLAEIQRPILRPEPKQQICHQHANTDHFGK